MKKNIKIGLFTIATMFVLAIVGSQVTRAGSCEDICTPQDNKMCIARGTICTNFIGMSEIEPLP